VGSDVCGYGLADVGLYKLLLEIYLGAFRSSPRRWLAGHEEIAVQDRNALEQFNNGDLGSFAHAWVGILEVRNELRHV
jgi:hypothetical protein